MLAKYKQGKVDLSEWEFLLDECLDFRGRLENGIKRRFGKVIQKQLMEDGVWVSLPFEWYPTDGRRGKAPKDPLTLCIGVPLGNDCADPVEFEISLLEVLENVVDGHINLTTGKVEDKEGVFVIKRIAKALRDAADEIESEIKSD